MTFGRIVTVLGLVVLGIYLFVSAPPPLPEEGVALAERSVPASKVLDTINAINAGTRKLYTSRIVGGGKKAGLKFDENWIEDDVQAGPLPALFLRLTAEKLQEKTPRIGLFLGSDEPINPSNLFEGKQADSFRQIKATRDPQRFAMPDGYQVAMYADLASAAPCVSCHNAHPDTPKKDWKLGDVMGATTWTFERGAVTPDEYRRMVAVYYRSAREAYETYLKKAKSFDNPPKIGTEWPDEGKRVLPDADTFMAAAYDATGLGTLHDLLDIETPADKPDAVASIDDKSSRNAKN